MESLILVGAYEHLAGSIREPLPRETVAGVAARCNVARVDTDALRAADDLEANLLRTHSDTQQPTATTIRHRKQTKNKEPTTKQPTKEQQHLIPGLSAFIDSWTPEFNNNNNNNNNNDWIHWTPEFNNNNNDGIH